MKIDLELSKRIEEFLKENNHLSEAEQLGEIYTRFGIQLSKYHYRKLGGNTMAKEVKSEDVKEKKKFHVDGEEIYWKYRRGEVRMTVDNLDKIFYQYSKHGLNMSQVKVQNEHGLSALEWQSLKRTFDLVKDSDVFSPYTLSFYSGKEKCDMIAAKVAEKYSDKNMRDVVAYEDDKQRRRAYDKAIKKEASLEYRRQQFEDGLLEYITKAKKAPLVKKTRDVRDTHAIVHVCDLHIGADIEEERNLPAYNIETVFQKMERVAREVNLKKAKKVTVVINGDLIETFTGLNHINSWKNIDKKYGYGVNATIKAIEVVTDLLQRINNIDSVILISGNHDRVTSNNHEDVSGEAAQWIHYVLQKTFEKWFSVEWYKDVATMELEGCGFVFTHGHLGISKKNPDHIVNQYGYKDLYNLVVMGHLHNRKVLADNYHNRTVHAPSIFTGNDYSKGLGYSSRSGFLYITVKNGLPLVADYSI